MNPAAAIDEKDLVYTLLGAGLSLQPRHVQPSGSCEIAAAGQGQIRLSPGPGAGVERMRQVLSQAGYRFDEADGKFIVLGRDLSHDLLLGFELPFRLVTLNPMTRIHWSKKPAIFREMSLELMAAVPYQNRPRTPLENIEIEIERYSTKEPDQENRQSATKWLLDLMQPFHQKSRPYGMGWILSDAPSCLKDCRVRHVSSKLSRTEVRIYRAKPAFPRIAP